MADRCAPPSRRHRKLSFSPRAISTTRWSLQARFKGDDPEPHVIRASPTPTVTMFEKRMALIEERGGSARHRERHGGGVGGADGPAQGGRAYRRRARAVRLDASMWSRICCPRFGVASTLVDGVISMIGGRPCARDTKTAFLEKFADQSDARTRRHRRASPRSCTAPARRSWSTTCSPRPCFSIR